METALLTALTIHNPWLTEPASQRQRLRATLPSPFIPREQPLRFGPDQAELVVGPRQAGKSTWIRYLLSEQDRPVLLLHAEEPRVRELGGSPAAIMDAIHSLLDEETILFFEEVQHLADASLLLKGLVDLEPGRRIVATGSTSFALSARRRESLAGRARRTRLLPFSLSELANDITPGLARPIRDQQLADLWQRLVVVGGYPRPWLGPDPASLLRSLVEAFVLRDASDLLSISRPGAFRKLLELAAADIGNLINRATWASLAGVSRGTTERYLTIAEDAHLIHLVPPFVGGRRAEITGRPKIFFVDNGLRNALFGGFQPESNRADRGALWENAVYTELLKTTELLDDIRYWRTKSGAEIDFVVQRSGHLVGIEVKASRLRRPTLSRSARSFLEAYRPTVLGVVNGALRADEKVGDVLVRYRRPWELDEILEGLDGQRPAMTR